MRQRVQSEALSGLLRKATLALIWNIHAWQHLLNSTIQTSRTRFNLVWYCIWTPIAFFKTEHHTQSMHLRGCKVSTSSFACRSSRGCQSGYLCSPPRRQTDWSCRRKGDTVTPSGAEACSTFIQAKSGRQRLKPLRMRPPEHMTNLAPAPATG